MRKNLSIAVLFLASLLILSVQAFAQPISRVDERIQQTVVRNSRIDLAKWLRVSRFDVRDTEVLTLSLSGSSFPGGEIEILANRRVVARMQFRRLNSRRTFNLPQGVTLDRVELRIKGEVYIERIAATLKERRFAPRPPRRQPRGHHPRR